MILGKVLDFAIKIKVVHSIPGRLRINAPAIKKVPREWQIKDDNIASTFKAIKGVKEIEFSYITGNILIKYDQNENDEKGILKSVKKMIQILLSYRKEFENISMDQLKDEIAKMSQIVRREMGRDRN